MIIIEIRDALAADDDEEENIAISFDNLYQSKNIFQTIKSMLLPYVPLRSNYI